MGRKLLVFFLLISFSAICQDSDIPEDSLLSIRLGKNFKSYSVKSDRAYFERDYERADFLFDSLVKNVVNGSYMDNFKVRKLSGKRIHLYDFEKPVFLMTYAAWCTPGTGEIPALNDIANKYHKDIDFVVLFWDDKKAVKKFTKKYSHNITILYVDENENNHDHIIQTLKHTLGFPTSFFLNQDKKIVDVRRGVLHPYNEKYELSFELNYTAFYNGISLLKNFDGSLDRYVIDDE